MIIREQKLQSMAKHLKLLILLFIISALTVAVLTISSTKTTSFPVVQNKKLVTPNATEAPFAIAKAAPFNITDSIVGSPDGKMELTLSAKKTTDGVAWRLIVKNTGEEAYEIYKETLPEGIILSIPANTFSPTNKYLFLEESDGEDLKYLLLKTNGEEFAEDLQTLEISSLFYQKYKDYKITDVTGWGGYTVLIVNVDKLDGTPGPSFWFDATTKSFSRLSTRFN